MHKVYKKLMFFIILCVVFVSNPAQATDVISIQQTETTWSFNLSSAGIGGFNGQRFLAQNNNISKFSLKGGTDYNGTGKTFQLVIREYPATTTLLLDQSFTDMTITDGAETVFTISPAVALTPGNYYEIGFLSGDSLSWQGDVYGNDYYTYSQCVGTVCVSSPGFALNDYWFKIYWSDTYVGRDQVVPITPAQGAVDVSSPVSFTGTFNSTGIYDKLKLVIYNRDEALPNEEFSKLEYVASSTVGVGVNQSYSSNITLKPGNYKYLAFLQNSYTASTSLELLMDAEGKGPNPWYYFSVEQEDGSHTPLLGPSDAVLDYCNTPVSTSTNPVIRYTVEGFRDVICLMFIPDSSFFDDLEGSVADLTTKAPLGYFDLASTTIASFATSSVATTTNGLTVANWNILNGVKDFTIFALLRTLISYLFIVLAVIYVIKRLRSFIKI